MRPSTKVARWTASRMVCLLVLLAPAFVHGFVVRVPPPTATTMAPFPHRHTTTVMRRQAVASPKSSSSPRGPSKVVDPDGPTPTVTSDAIEEVDPADIPELQDLDDVSQLPPGPVPHQPWRRGVTAGCEAPIAAAWRQKAHGIIDQAVTLVGGRVLDVTWFLTNVVVTLDEDMLPPRDWAKASGPPISIQEPSPTQYRDPNDPEPEEIVSGDDEVLYQRETEEEAADAAQRAKNMYATKDADDPPDQPHNPDKTEHDDIPLYMNEETRDDMAVMVAEQERDRFQEAEQPMDIEYIKIDTAALSTIAQAILDGLEEYEEELQILARHELILTSPGPPDVIETQRQFDAYRGSYVLVETQDPFESNRTLRGTLVDRNAMDLMINKKGRLVTIPHNFVKCVRLSRSAASSSEEEEEEGDE